MESRALALHQAFEPFLTPESGAGWISMPGGHVLLHPGHMPPGVFVVATGLLRSVDEHGVTRDVAAPCVVPALGAWDVPSLHAWSLKTDSELLFIPRSRLLEPSAYREALERVIAETIAHPAIPGEET